MAQPTNPDRLPPYSEEAERGVLSCILQDPMMSMGECEETGVKASWFYDVRHQWLYHVCAQLQGRGAPIDLISLQDQLAKEDKVSEVGGIAYISTLADAAPSAANLAYYLEILVEHHRRRQLLRACQETIAEIHDPAAAEVFANAERKVLAMAEIRAGEREREVKAVLQDVIDGMERYHRGSAQIVGLTCGLEYVDKLLCGIGGDNGNLMVVAGRPGTGKTSFALDMALHVAIDYKYALPKKRADGTVEMDGDKPVWEEHRGVPVAIFSLEMSETALVKRMLFQRARADLQRFRTGFATQEDFIPLTKASAELGKAKMWIDDTGRCTIGEIKAKARRLVRQHGVKLIIVDYIQLLRADGKRFRDDRVQELAEISGELQNLGKTLGVPFLVLAQMNRDYEKDPKRAPRLSDLKDCGAIEQDADQVGFLYEPKLDDEAAEFFEECCEKVFNKGGKPDWSRYPQRVNLLWAKNRFGPTGPCQLLFLKSSTHFEDWNAWLKQHGLKKEAAGEKKATPKFEMD